MTKQAEKARRHERNQPAWHLASRKRRYEAWRRNRQLLRLAERLAGLTAEDRGTVAGLLEDAADRADLSVGAESRRSPMKTPAAAAQERWDRLHKQQEGTV